ncbi:hypothetical protein LR48_Vigan681s000500 [Vigna angularis]|uniref:Uncharacterized protein n=1 Tax=Phaseolus angularis TaxID=3914 RepID=A0A0L9TH03_PHAAN|nr:hypothetical protein LR48_Vigan681s000500 [Vigna angularis]
MMEAASLFKIEQLLGPEVAAEWRMPPPPRRATATSVASTSPTSASPLEGRASGGGASMVAAVLGGDGRSVGIGRQWRFLVKKIGHFIERLKDFGVENKVNPREECQAMIFGSDKTLDEKEIERKEKEELSEKDKDVEKEREVVEREERKKICLKIKKVSGKREEKKKVREKKICVKIKKVREKKKRTRGKKKESYEKLRPHPKKYHRKEKELERFMEIFKKLEIKVPMIETLQHVPGLIKFLKKFCRKKKKEDET